MRSGDRRLRVGWKASNLSAGMASLRYRALLPILALQQRGIESILFTTGLDAHLDAIDVLVIVKSFTPEDVYLAQRASERGIPVVFDLCDNIFVDSYGAGAKGKIKPAQVFQELIPYLNAVVVTTEPLAERVRAAHPEAQVHVVADGIETPETVQQCFGVIRSAVALERASRFRVYGHKLRVILRRVRQEGLLTAPRLARKGLRRLLVKARNRAAARWHRLRAPVVPAVEPARSGDDRAAAGSPAPKIVWFGNHGAPHARFGILDLLDIRKALETAAREFGAELVVVSNNRQKFEKFIRPLAIPSHYAEWSPATVTRWLDAAAVVVIPNSLDDFSLCKSANRTVLAVSRGVPVVATPTPALDALAPHVHTGDTLEGLRKYLGDPAVGRADALAARAAAEAAFGQKALGAEWAGLLERLRAGGPARSPQHVPAIVVLQLVQDIELALPVMAALAAQGCPAQAWCSATLVRKVPRILGIVRSIGAPLRIFPEDLFGEDIQLPPGVRVVLTVSETNLNPHRFSRGVSDSALRQGVPVATLQHGFENVGLTYDDAVHAISRIDFAAQRIYIWGPESTLHPAVKPDVRRRCIPAGCPKPAVVPTADLGALLPAGMPIVGIFENLHWHRYDDSYRSAFLEAVNWLARAAPGTCFLVKPHQAGLWLTHRYQGELPMASNIVIADPQAPVWENHTAPALLGLMSAVITTPSTVALDAARRGIPVAVVAGNLESLPYEPLPLLRSQDDWMAFVQAALLPEGGAKLRQACQDFVDRVLLPGDAAERIARDLIAFAKN